MLTDEAVFPVLAPELGYLPLALLQDAPTLRGVKQMTKRVADR